MTDQIDSLKTNGSEIDQELQDLQSNENLSVKNKDAAADKDVDVLREMQEIQDKTEADTIKEREDTAAVVSSSSRALNLEVSVNNTTNTSVENSSDTQDTNNKEGFWDKKIWPWIKEQWGHIRNKESREKETWTNAARAVWFAWAWLLSWLGLKSIFSKEKREERKARRKARRDARSSKRRERKADSFRERPIGKVVKYSWIWTAVYYVVHGLKTGKWGILDLFNWNDDVKDDSVESQVDAYDQLSLEQRELYNNLWNTVDEFYWSIWNKEVEMGYEDPNSLWTVVKNIKLKDWKNVSDYTWLVPFCIDTWAKNINEILSEKDLNEYVFNKNINELKNKIKWRRIDKLEKWFGPFVDKLASFQPFWVMTWLSLGEKIKKWLEYDEKSRQYELDYFFRQYVKVLSFVKDKEKALQYRLAENEIKTHWYKNKSLPSDENKKLDLIEDALDDEERFKENIENNDVYKQFMDSKLLGCHTVLEWQNLMNWEMSSELKDKISKLDEETDKLLQIEDWKSALDRWISEISWWLTEWTKKEIIEVCNDVKDDIVDDSWTGFFQEYMEWFSYLCNMDDSNKETFLRESWLENFAENYIWVIDEYREKIKRWEAMVEDLQKLKELSLEWTAFKKEMNLAMHTLSSIRSDDPDLAWRVLTTSRKVVTSLVEHTKNILKWDWRFWDVLSIVVTWWTVYLVTHPGKLVKVAVGTVKGTLHWIWWVAWRPWLSALWLQKFIKNLPTTSAKKSSFLHYVLNWKVTNESRLLKIARQELWIEADSLAEMLTKIDLGLQEDEARTLLKYVGDKNIGKLCISEEISDNATIKEKFLRKSSGRKFTVKKNFVKELQKIDVKIESLGKWVKDTINSILRNVDNIEDMKYVTSLVEDSNFMESVWKLNKTELRQLKSCSIKNLKEMQQKIKSWEIGTIKEYLWSIWGKVDSVDGVRKTFNRTIDDAIATLRELPDSKLCVSQISKLEELKKSADLSEEAMDSFVKFLTKWFKAENLPDLVKLLKVEDVLSEWKTVWKYLEDLLSKWDYRTFNTFIKNADNAKYFKWIKVEKIAGNFDDLGKALKLWNKMDDFIKAVAKIIAKIL